MSVFRHFSERPADDPAAEPPEPSSGSAHASELRRSISQAAEQIDEIISAAEDAATQIHADAEREAERYLTERRRQADLLLEEQRAALTEAFAGLRRQVAQMEASALEAAEPVPAPLADREHRPSRVSDQPIPPPKAYPGVGRAERGFGQPVTSAHPDRAPAVIRAAQLAILGKTRDEIELELRNELGVERPGEIVDEIFPSG